MCGIVGYIGSREAGDILLEGLKRLEYRGYDSAGMAILSGQKIDVRRSVGKISALEAIIHEPPLKGKLGLGHTRWATHGKPSDDNAHPHTDCSGQLVIVHNGIIENYPSLKTWLESRGHVFKSQTDTEVIAHLIEEYLIKEANQENESEAGERRSTSVFPKKHKTQILYHAVRAALERIQGAYALGILWSEDPEHLVAARKDCPLVIGLGEGEYFIASDVPAILTHTRRIIYLDEGEVAVISKEGYTVYNVAGQLMEKKVTKIMWDAVAAEKSGYRHFMLKEIYEQPRVITDTLRGRLDMDHWKTNLSETNIDENIFRTVQKVMIVACGTSWHAGLVGKFWMENVAKIPCEVDIGSEYRYREPIISPDTLFVSISQSGETADTIAALRMAKMMGANILSICNVVGSTITRDSHGVLYTHCGPEIGVASTKAFTGQLTALLLLALHLGISRGKLSRVEAESLIRGFVHLSALVRRSLDLDQTIEKLAKKFFKRTNFLYLGRGLNYPIALEGALKLKEISYIHAEGYPAGEMKHGPIALIDENMPVVAIATKSKVYEKVLSNIEEAKARGGVVIALATEGDVTLKGRVDHILSIPETPRILAPVVNTIPLQLLAYHISVLRGCDVDQPRNLAKSVTVE